ncbi:hypothetical protein MNBD_NITROSPINAE02-1573 [hydrothermal vent metagenome]|uniref:Uncharacterized protein n=1 Tax=hydrothermal vent metagenome TaxID=652676 RepID=A0A3B1C2A6_9ZZZZ
MKKLAIGLGAMILLTAFGDPVYFNVKEGNELYKKEKYSESLERYRNAQNGNPKSKAVAYNLGNALYKLGRYPEAAEAYTRALTSSDPMIKKEAGYNRGTALLKGGEAAAKEMKLDMAEPMLRESVKQLKTTVLNYPDRLDARHNLELAIEKLGELEKQKREQKKDEQGEDPEEGDDSESQQKEDKQKNEDDQKKTESDKGMGDKEKENKEQKQANRPDQEMTAEKARQIMNAVERDERKLREKMRAGKPEDSQRHEKDW